MSAASIIRPNPEWDRAGPRHRQSVQNAAPRGFPVTGDGEASISATIHTTDAHNSTRCRYAFALSFGKTPVDAYCRPHAGA